MRHYLGFMADVRSLVEGRGCFRLESEFAADVRSSVMDRGCFGSGLVGAAMDECSGLLSSALRDFALDAADGAAVGLAHGDCWGFAVERAVEGVLDRAHLLGFERRRELDAPAGFSLGARGSSMMCGSVSRAGALNR